MKKYMYLQIVLFFTAVVTLVAYLAFPTMSLAMVQVAFVMFIPAFMTLFSVALIGRSGKKMIHAMLFVLALTLSMFVAYFTLTTLDGFIHSSVSSLAVIVAGVIGIALLTAKELKLDFFATLLSFTIQALGMCFFLVH